MVSERLVRCVRRVCAARGACRGTGTTQSKEHSVDECGWASNELHEQPKPNPRTEVQPRTKQRNAEAIEYQTTADPKASNTSTGTGTSHHLSHTHSQSRRRRPGGSGRHWDFAAFCTKRSRGARTRQIRVQRGGVQHGGQGKAVATCWQQCWQKGRCGPAVRWAPSRNHLRVRRARTWHVA